MTAIHGLFKIMCFFTCLKFKYKTDARGPRCNNLCLDSVCISSCTNIVCDPLFVTQIGSVGLGSTTPAAASLICSLHLLCPVYITDSSLFNSKPVPTAHTCLCSSTVENKTFIIYTNILQFFLPCTTFSSVSKIIFRFNGSFESFLFHKLLGFSVFGNRQ